MTKSVEIGRVVHVIYSGLGGHSAVLFELLGSGFFADADHLVLLAGVEPPLADTISRLDDLGIGWRYVRKESGRNNITFFRTLRNRICESNPDLIFLHGLAAVPAVTMRRSRSVVLLRESESPSTKRFKDWCTLALAHLNMSAIVHLTEDAAQAAEQKLGLIYGHKRVRIIGNGLDLDFYSPDPQRTVALLSGPTMHIGMVSRLQPNKDHLTLVKAFDRLRCARPEVDFQLHIAGEGTTRSDIKAAIVRRGLEDHVNMYGALSSVEVRDLLRRLDIYVHATFGETMSNSIMQAMATGAPVIASDVSGVRNMITPGLGRLYSSLDADALFNEICDWLDDPGEARRCGVAARAYAVENYDATKMVLAYESLATSLRRKHVP